MLVSYKTSSKQKPCVLSQYETVIFSLSCQISFLKIAWSLDKFSLNAKFDEHIPI